MRETVIGCAVAFMGTVMMTPTAMAIAWRVGAVDRPRDWRRMHRRVIPRAGGIALLLGFFLGWSVAWRSGVGAGEWRNAWIGIAVGGAGMAAVGLTDDVFSMSAWQKLGAQTAVAISAVVIGGVGEDLIRGTAAVLWLLIAVNAHNMIDGMDGLMTGCAACECGALGAAFLLAGERGMGAISLCLAAACMGLRCFNRYPARIFAGDCGSECVGFLVGMLALLWLRQQGGGAAWISVLLMLAYPLTDLFAAVLRRVLRGKSPFTADRGHLHHRLFDAGVPHPTCTRLLLTVSGALCATGVLVSDSRFWGWGAAASGFCALILMGIRYFVENFAEIVAKHRKM